MRQMANFLMRPVSQRAYAQQRHTCYYVHRSLKQPIGKEGENTTIGIFEGGSSLLTWK